MNDVDIKYHYMECTTGTSNKFYEMLYYIGEPYMYVRYGKIGTIGSISQYDPYQWNDIYNKKRKKGYVDVSEVELVFDDGVLEKIQKMRDYVVSRIKQLKLNKTTLNQHEKIIKYLNTILKIRFLRIEDMKILNEYVEKMKK